MQTYYVTLLLLQLGHRSESVLVDGYSANAIMKVGNTLHCIGDHWSSRFNADNIVQMFDDGSVLGTNISQTLEHRFVCAHWRQNHAFGTVYTLA